MVVYFRNLGISEKVRTQALLQQRIRTQVGRSKFNHDTIIHITCNKCRYPGDIGYYTEQKFTNGNKKIHKDSQ